ncbi:MAG: 50S ribosomal protein L23 [Planctomycetes bacterium]|nr:50S ribosomal protein L23 [Planctomycetota bacterium]
MRLDHSQIIRRPLVTERNMHRAEVRNQYTFEVVGTANKVEIRKAIESLFNVRVQSVNTTNVKGKVKRRGWHVYTTGKMKKAVVTLHPEDKIDLL